MKSSPENSDEAPTPPDSSAVILLIKDIGNVTWRMFTPLLTGLAVGFLVDKTAALAPWGVLVGMFVGIVGSILLTKKVFKNI